MKWKHKKRIAYRIAKEFWNKSEPSLRLAILRKELNFSICDSEQNVYDSDLISLSDLDWNELALYKRQSKSVHERGECTLEPFEIRDCTLCYLAIGIYSNRESSNIQYQREYKLQILNYGEPRTSI